MEFGPWRSQLEKVGGEGVRDLRLLVWVWCYCKLFNGNNMKSYSQWVELGVDNLLGRIGGRA